MMFSLVVWLARLSAVSVQALNAPYSFAFEKYATKSIHIDGNNEQEKLFRISVNTGQVVNCSFQARLTK